MLDRAKTLARVTRECLAVHDKPTWANLAALMSEEERAAFHGKDVEIELPAGEKSQDSGLLNCPNDVLEQAIHEELSVTDGQTETPHSELREASRLENPYEAMRQAEQALNDARQELRDRRNAVQASRIAFGKALADWNRGAPISTPLEAAREFIATSQRERAAKAAAGQGVFYPGVTRTAKALAGGNRQPGGGAAFRRGALTKAQAQTVEANRLRTAALAAKTSQR